jgi:hypothetical protein
VQALSAFFLYFFRVDQHSRYGKTFINPDGKQNSIIKQVPRFVLADSPAVNSRFAFDFNQVQCLNFQSRNPLVPAKYRSNTHVK